MKTLMTLLVLGVSAMAFGAVQQVSNSSCPMRNQDRLVANTNPPKVSYSYTKTARTESKSSASKARR